MNDKIGLTFDVGLRSILRQDPDIIMIGEIRDVETAKIAIRAASTGHLVISTMHTNDAISSINRLMEMKLPPYLISSTLIGVISQKLVRKICNNCNHGIVIKNDVDEEININTELGCDKCEDTGYYGRTAIYEILEINENHPIADKIKKLYQKDQEELKNYAKILYSEARLIEGLSIENPTEISNLICNLISK